MVKDAWIPEPEPQEPVTIAQLAWVVTPLVGVAICLLLSVLSGCGPLATEGEQLEKYKPMKLAESDGVTLWRVRDGGVGGYRFVYYTTPNGHIVIKD